MEADGLANTKIRERTEGAATAVQTMHRESCSVNRVDPDLMCSTSFGDDCTGPPAPPCPGENALVNNGAAAPKSCLPPLEMRSSTAAGGLLPTCEASIVTRNTFNQPPLRLYSTEETILRRHQPKTSHTTAASGGITYLLSTPPGGLPRKNPCIIGCSILAVLGRLRACPLLGTWRALLCGEVMRVEGGW